MQILDVPTLTAYVKALVEEDAILCDIWVRGEVSNFSRSSAGHMYFCLTDGQAQINCVLFRGAQRGLLAQPAAGEAVLAHGRVTIYEARGQYQLLVDNIAPEGIGILQLAFEETRRRLDEEGLFAPGRKRPLPRMPRVIGVVTSAQSAVWQDIQTVVRRRFPLVELVLAPSAVQGADAPAQLVAALRALQDDGRAELIIMARGGGSADDLACFNDERLARAIYAAAVPVVSAVGHETDTTIADLVADLRAPTPSAAAELCVPDRDELLAVVRAEARHAALCMDEELRKRRDALTSLTTRVERLHPLHRLHAHRATVEALRLHAQERIVRELEKRRRASHELMVRAQLLDPRDALRRGYAIVTARHDGRERRVTSAVRARQHGALNLTFEDGMAPVVTTKDTP